MLKKILLYCILAVIITGIPSGLVYVDYINDDLTQNNRSITPFSVGVNDSSVFAEIPIRELPEFSEINIFLNYTKPVDNESLLLTVYIIEEVEYASFIEGEINEDLITKLVIPETFVDWFNNTIQSPGLVRILFATNTVDLNIEITGAYLYITESYIARNIFEILTYGGLYVLIVFGAIPNIVRRFKINKLKTKKQEELMKEEQEFYNKLEKKDLT